MNQPVSYLQTDPRWANKDYSAKGEKTTIGASGCGPTSLSMVLATWVDKDITPATECAWALSHGYKAPRQGTYYGYFPPACARFGLKCRQVNYTNLYGNPSSPIHAQAKAELDKGCLVIACMGKGLWTSSGHFVLVWNITGNVIHINDPASTKAARTRGDYSLFRSQVKYYFVVEPPKNTPAKEDELNMTIPEFLNKLTDEQAYNLMQKANRHADSLKESEWSQKEGNWQALNDAGITDGSAPCRSITREETAAILGRMGLIKK